MIVCLCSGVSEAAIDAAIAGGASTPEDVVQACGAGRDCRACCPLLESLLERASRRVYEGAIASG